MAEYHVLYWKDIPSVVEAKDESSTVKIQLSRQFEELIDAVAMKEGLMGSDEYLNQWRRGDTHLREGSAKSVAEAVVAELEAQFPELRARRLGKES